LILHARKIGGLGVSEVNSELEKSIKAKDKKKEKKNFFKSWVLVLPYIHRQGYIWHTPLNYGYSSKPDQI
jgi:hypothetical protein